MNMKLLKKILIIFIMFFCYIDVKAAEIEINPLWEEYNKLSDEEKAKYEAIPDKYIYAYESKNKFFKNFNIEKENAFADNSYANLPKFSLYNLDGKRYANTFKEDQGSLGLCWNFAGQGATESSLMFHGVEGLAEAIEKCNNDSNSKYCKYKEDYDKNQSYINKESDDNLLFSKRYIDYIRAKPTGTTAYNRNKTNIYYTVEERYNPFNTNGSLGEGGTMEQILNFYSQGIAPLRNEGVFSNYTSNHDTFSLQQIFTDRVGDYQIKDAFQTGYCYPSSSNYQECINNVKETISTYGALYVATSWTTSDKSCWFTNYDYKEEVDNYKDNYSLMLNTAGICKTNSAHALQIVGWDDNYNYEYCQYTNSDGVRKSSNSKDYMSKETCDTNNGNWISGKGAWLIKNSWGKTSAYKYIYMPYSASSTKWAVRRISVKDYNNVYSYKFSINTKTKHEEKINNTQYSGYVYEYTKANGSEYINSINFRTSYTKVDYQLYLSNDGENYELIKTATRDYPGLETIDIDNYKINGNKFYIKILNSGSNIRINDINVFTRNECYLTDSCSDEEEIKLGVDKYLFDVDIEKINVIAETQNISSGTKLNYNIYNSNQENVSDKFSVESNYVINNMNIGYLVPNKDVPGDTYKLVVDNGTTSNSVEFEIMDKPIINLLYDEPIYYSKTNPEDNKIKINLDISHKNGLISEEWSSSDTSVATIDENGEVTFLKSGKTEITYSIELESGSYKKTIELVSYEKINSTSDFINNVYSNEKRAFKLMNDLDFTGINLNNYDLVTFNGIFDGDNHTISGVNKTGTTSKPVGLFNNVSEATITNFKFINSEINGIRGAKAGAIVGNASSNTLISNIYSSATVNSQNYAGGIVGIIANSTISECVNVGKIEAVSNTNYNYAAGIAGIASFTKIKNSYNSGSIHAGCYKDDSQSFAAGIVADSSNSSIENCYNSGTVLADSTNSTVKLNSAGLYLPRNTVESEVINSYYVENELYTNDNIGSTNYYYMLEQSNYINWDFENTWIIEENSFPQLRRFYESKTIVTNIKLINPLKLYNLDKEYDFDFEIISNKTISKNDIEVSSSDTNVFEIINNKIVPKNEGQADITFKYGNSMFTQTITIKKLFEVNYNNEEWVNNYKIINTKLNYDELKTDEYIKLNYKINNGEWIEINNNKNEYEINNTINMTENGFLEIKYAHCNNNSCVNIENASKTIEINRIDKIKPTINYQVDNLSKTIQITLNDELSGLNKSNIYKYAITNQNKILPTTFTNYTNGTKQTYLSMNYNNKYLWIYNIEDNAGNKLCNNNLYPDYCLYDLEISKLNYKVKYYKDDKKTLVDEKNYLEDDSLLDDVEKPESTLCDIYHDCIFKNWEDNEHNIINEGYIINKNLDLYPTYDKNLKQYILNLDIDNHLNIGQTYKIQYKTLPEQMKDVIENVTYQSSNENIFKINNDTIIPVSEGTAYLTITTEHTSNTFEITIVRQKYTLTYKDDDNTILKTEDIYYGKELNLNYTLQNKVCDKYYNCLFNKWDGHTNGEIITSDIEVIANYTKTIFDYNLNYPLDNEELEGNKEYTLNYNYNIKGIEEVLKIDSITSNNNELFTVNENKIKTNLLKEDSLGVLTIKVRDIKTNNIKTFNFNIKILSSKIKSNIYKIEDNLIKFPATIKGISIETFKKNIINSNSYNLYNNNGIVNEGIVKTGMEFSNGISKYYIVMFSDVNGDGKITPLDYIKIKNHVMEKSLITAIPNYLAADINEDGKITPLDYVRIKNIIMSEVN